MTQQRAGDIERAVFGKYLEKMKKDLNEADTSIVFEVGRTIGFMQKSLYDELSKEVEHCEGEDVHEIPSDEMTLEQARQAVKDLRKALAERLGL